MKKKIINGILMVALVAATSASFVSCKDNDEDMQAEFLALQAQNQTDLNDLKNRVNALEEADKDLITSVIINATSTSILDNSKLFPGVNMQFLGTTYGEAGLPVNFPSVDEYTGTKFSASAGDKLFEPNATIYFTANPSNIDAAKMAKVTLSLINSQGATPSYLTLGTAKASSKVLTFGTRAAGDVNLWEVPVTVTDPTALGQLDPTQIIDAKQVAEHVKAIIEEAQNTKATEASIKSAGRAILSETATMLTEAANVELPDLPAFGLKAEWTCKVVGKRDVKSDYTLAATAFKPIDFYYGQGFLEGTTVSFDVIERSVAKVVRKIKSMLPSKMSPINISVGMPTETSLTFTIEGVPTGAEVEISGTGSISSTPTDATGKVTIDINDITSKIATTVTITKEDKVVTVDLTDVLQSVVDAINGGIDVTSINNMIKDVNTLIESVDDYADKTQNLSKRVTNFLNNLSNRFFNKLANEGFYAFLQPVMLIDNGKTTYRLVPGATIEKGSYNLVPTTVTNELLAPAFKKYVAVKKDGAVKAEKLMTKGEANFDNYAADLSEAGDYEIVYAALDFYGNEVVKRYNVTVQ